MPDSPPSTEPPSHPREWWALAALTLAALALRLYRLTHFELWVDEGATWYFARLIAAGNLAEQLVVEPTPPFYYGLVGLLMRLGGESDAMMRLPSAIFGAAAVPALYLFGRELWSRRAGFIAAFLVAVHPLHLFYSREARVYPLLMLLAALLWLVLWRASSAGAARHFVLFASLLTIACYSHLFALFLGLTSGAWILVGSSDKATRLRGLAAAALAGLLFLPYLWWIFPHLEASGAAWSVAALEERYPEDWRFGRIVETSFLGAHYGPFLRQISDPPTPPLLRAASLVVQMLLIGAAAFAALAMRRQRAFGFLLVTWLVPLLVPWFLHQERAFFHPGRHDFYVLGPALVLLAVGLDAVLSWGGRGQGPRGWARGLGVTLLCSVLALAAAQRLLALHAQPPTLTYRQVGSYLSRQASAGDRVIALGIRRLRAEHYARRFDSAVEIESFPRSTDFHPGWSDVLTLLEDEAALEREARKRIAELEGELDPQATLFVLRRSYPLLHGRAPAQWRVDRHLLESLPRAGWQRVAALESHELGITAFRPPARQGR